MRRNLDRFAGPGIPGPCEGVELQGFGTLKVRHRTPLDRYLEELEFRFNKRANPYIFCDTLARIVRTSPLGYRRLIALVGNGNGKE